MHVRNSGNMSVIEDVKGISQLENYAKRVPAAALNSWYSEIARARARRIIVF